MQETVTVEVTDIAGANPAATGYAHGSTVADIAIRVVVPGTDFDLAGFTRRQTTTLQIDDRQPVIGERPPDGAEAAFAPRINGDPGRLAATVALRHRDAEALLEAPPLGL